MSAAFVQGKVIAAGATSASPIAAAFDSPMTAGNSILVFVLHSYPNTPPTCSDSQGNTYSQVVETGDLTPIFAERDCLVFHALVGSTGSNTVTVTYAAGIAGADMIEVSGLHATPFDQVNQKSNPEADSETGSVTTTTDGQFIVGFFRYLLPSGTWTAGSGTLRVADDVGRMLQTELQVSAGAIEATATNSAGSASYPNFGYIVTFKATDDVANDARIIFRRA